MEPKINEYPVFSHLTGNLGFGDGFARDCPPPPASLVRTRFPRRLRGTRGRGTERQWWLDAHRRYFARQASREGLELNDETVTVFAPKRAKPLSLHSERKPSDCAVPCRKSGVGTK